MSSQVPSDPSAPPESLGAGTQAKRRRYARRHLMDHIQTLRSHWLAVVLTFLVVFGLQVWSALFQKPIYRAAATIQLSPIAGNSGGAHYSDYWAWERSMEAAAEAEVMRSAPVARRAAERTETRATADIQEQNAYRPLEVILRSFSEPWQPCRLRAYAPPVRDGTVTYLIAFSADGSRVTIRRPSGEEVLAATPVQLCEPYNDRNDNLQWDPGEPFEDHNGNGVYDPAEPFRDLDRSGSWDSAESFTDGNANGRWDPAELFVDENRNERYDVGEYYDDADGNGRYDAAEVFLDANSNGIWDDAEPFTDLNKDGEYSGEESYYDRDGDGEWDSAEPFVDLDGDKEHDGGAPIPTGEDGVTLGVEEGNPAGRVFVLTRRSVADATTWIRSGVSVTEVGEYTGIMSLRFQANAPDVAARVANSLAGAYLDFVRDGKTQQDRNRVDWLLDEVTRIDAELADLERMRDDYVKRHRAVLLSERAQAILTEQGELFRQRLELEQRIRALDERLRELSGDLPADRKLLLLGGYAVDPKSQALSGEITGLEARRRILIYLEEVTEENPIVRRLDAEIEELNQILSDRLVEVVERRVAVLQEERGSLEHALERIAGEYERQERLLQELPDREREVAKRSRPIRVQEQMYQFLVRTLKEAQLSKESQVLPVRALNPAAIPGARVSPNLGRTLVLGVFLGLLAGIGLAFVLEYMVRTVRTPRELEDGLDLPLYGAIPDFSTVSRRDRKGIAPEGLVARDAPASLLAEAYRSLRASVRTHNPNARIRTLAITSALAREGKTVTTMNLAVAMAQSGGRVLVVDADLRRPQAHSILGVARSPGLVEVLRGEVEWEAAVQKTTVPDLFVLASGRTPHTPTSLLDSAAFRALYEDLRAGYDHVLFDVPPVLAVADAAAFLGNLDGVLLLSRYRRCTLETVDGAREQIERAHGNVIGVILNAYDARRVPRSGYGYYGYYGYHGHYARYSENSPKGGCGTGG